MRTIMMTTIPAFQISTDTQAKINEIIEARRAAHFAKSRTLTPAQQKEGLRIIREGGKEKLDAFVKATLRPSDHLVSRAAIMRELIDLGLAAYQVATTPTAPPKPKRKAGKRTDAPAI